jgi:hypothetical protein
MRTFSCRSTFLYAKKEERGRYRAYSTDRKSDLHLYYFCSMVLCIPSLSSQLKLGLESFSPVIQEWAKNFPFSWGINCTSPPLPQSSLPAACNHTIALDIDIYCEIVLTEHELHLRCIMYNQM